ncbi:membrane protein [Litchfieldella qijiaojingensis]|uniref:Membrane protein n=1 Tax=Litchfieldella qijiaojingensis TaxID=980347 RepID=A0ABQ2YE96_9GAMM|nr:PH domain-containing protein [Halomonas qijiaojingensis]GGX80784.1 membrane protein [Halomonas qijiaojingensis]
MTFSNSSVEPDTLPAVEEARLTSVSPRLAPCVALQQMWRWLLLTTLALLFPVTNATLAVWQPWFAAGVGGLGAMMIVAGWLEAKRRAYGVREHDVIYHRGLLIHRTQVLPLVRLQHVETLSSPIERAFGLVRLACFTAGGRGADLLLEGLPARRAEAVKHYLLSRLDSDGDGQPPPSPPPSASG